MAPGRAEILGREVAALEEVELLRRFETRYLHVLLSEEGQEQGVASSVTGRGEGRIYEMVSVPWSRQLKLLGVDCALLKIK